MGSPCTCFTAILLLLASIAVLSFAPEKVRNLHPTSISSTEVVLQWSAPVETNETITKYSVSITKNRPQGRADRGRNEILKETNYTTVIITGLNPYTKYTAAVVAHTSEAGPEGRLEFRTRGAVPGSVGLVGGKELRVRFNGTFIEIETPTVVNATRNTTLKAIVKGLSTCRPNQSKNLSPLAEHATNVTEWDAATYKVGKDVPESLKIFVEENRGVTANCSLHRKETYTIVFVATDWLSGRSAVLMAPPITLVEDEQLGTHSLAWLAIFPVLAFCMLVLYVWDRKRKRVWKQLREPSYSPPVALSSATTIQPEAAKSSVEYQGEWIYVAGERVNPSTSRKPSYLEIIPTSSTTMRRDNSTILRTAKSSIPSPGAEENQLSVRIHMVRNQSDFRSVSAEYFEEYVKDASASGLLRSQFMQLPKGVTRPCKNGRLPENMAKNRCRNIIAYDETRVVLKITPGDPYSDYINANYIKGYKKERAYIAAQGPKPNTVYDFWKMVWQENVRVISMLTNTIEDNKIKSEKYWPDVGTEVKYGDFRVTNMDDQVFSDYTIRTLELSYEQDKRKVMHFHYTEWPSCGILTYPPSFVVYLNKLQRAPTGKGPIVVNCGTGIGRTGTLILCDICLRRAAAEKVIDVTAVITEMRASRVNMVCTVQQYILAHIIITEGVASLPTQIPCTAALSTRIQKMRIQLPSDIRRLKDVVWRERALHSLAAPKTSIAEDVANGELRDFVPDGPAADRSDLSESKNNQVNAVSVDGVKVKKQYLAYWLPSPFAISHFWGFVVERSIKLIVILQCSDPRYPSCSDIMPNESILLPVPHIQVTDKTSYEEKAYCTNEELLVTDTSEGNARTRSVTVLTCKEWGHSENGKPPTPAALVSLWKASEKIPRKEGETLVLCHDGVTACGLYLAMSFLLERMALERECDVISAVRAVRRSRPEFVQSMEQFNYLYDAAVSYAE